MCVQLCLYVSVGNFSSVCLAIVCLVICVIVRRSVFAFMFVCVCLCSREGLCGNVCLCVWVCVMF